MAYSLPTMFELVKNDFAFTRLKGKKDQQSIILSPEYLRVGYKGTLSKNFSTNKTVFKYERRRVVSKQSSPVSTTYWNFVQIRTKCRFSALPPPIHIPPESLLFVERGYSA